MTYVCIMGTSRTTRRACPPLVCHWSPPTTMEIEFNRMCIYYERELFPSNELISTFCVGLDQLFSNHYKYITYKAICKLVN